MARLKGSKNKPGSLKPGRKPSTIDPEYTTLKNSVLDIIESELADNLSEAAKLLSVKPTLLYKLARRDKEWEEQVVFAQQVVADRLEAKLDRSNSPVAQIFRLKKLRPEYRDNYKFDFDTSNLEKLLKELVEAGHTQSKAEVVPIVKEIPKEVADADTVKV